MMARIAIIVMILFAGCAVTPQEDGLSEGKSDREKKTEMITLRYAEAGEVYDALKKLLGDPPSPTVAEDQRTNSIIVMGTPEEIGRVKEVISVMDKKSPVKAD